MFWCCAESSNNATVQMLPDSSEHYSSAHGKGVAEPGATFEVELNLNGQLGLELDLTDGENGPMITAIMDGSVKEFNETKSRLALKVYDRIGKVNGVTGKTIDLHKALSASPSEGSVQLSLQRPQERTVVLHKTGELGINLHYKKNSAGIVIKDIIDGGLVDKWNRDHPEAVVTTGDRIVSFNGEAMKGADLVNKLKVSSILTLKVLHY
mmetsp:Transcript_30283/g.54936  ORF Transcript_30283/g.54936 Transcript_30283/m.54936 type:complete len:209 (-) Transcript_30283:62-688(-)|eukprot:CAMPEP_0197654592 /NCGR_PEP_ID=MMETSP1338-20131121/38940_1 /TAXON_ID=43686 ORGANISM="Pelagodinium beii, Strain RCC1491" /NCGR_SAMPLE_ID=MMETSP1338 /ASSEMBLY_ACC=CAM_ASM_000754 /LENGTH=208 /DNA_ID=CAMNT_0043230061 /DNA_START=60 /DNA_END=686 /DNA_ORIENTATION=+